MSFRYNSGLLNVSENFCIYLCNICILLCVAFCVCKCVCVCVCLCLYLYRYPFLLYWYDCVVNSLDWYRYRCVNIKKQWVHNVCTFLNSYIFNHCQNYSDFCFVLITISHFDKRWKTTATLDLHFWTPHSLGDAYGSGVFVLSGCLPATDTVKYESNVLFLLLFLIT